MSWVETRGDLPRNLRLAFSTVGTVCVHSTPVSRVSIHNTVDPLGTLNPGHSPNPLFSNTGRCSVPENLG